MTITELCKKSHEMSVSKGWYDSGDRNIGELLMLTVSELSEALEELRSGHTPKEVYVKDGKPEGFSIEIADAFIRLGDMCAYLDIDIEKYIMQKMEFNATRPNKHGRKF